MEILKEKSNVPERSWTNKAEGGRSVEADFYPELRNWVQRAIIEAEKHGNFEKKSQLLSLLKEL